MYFSKKERRRRIWVYYISMAWFSTDLSPTKWNWWEELQNILLTASQRASRSKLFPFILQKVLGLKSCAHCKPCLLPRIIPIFLFFKPLKWQGLPNSSEADGKLLFSNMPLFYYNPGIIIDTLRKMQRNMRKNLSPERKIRASSKLLVLRNALPFLPKTFPTLTNATDVLCPISRR